MPTSSRRKLLRSHFVISPRRSHAFSDRQPVRFVCYWHESYRADVSTFVSAGEYMAGRTYKGLEPRFGMDAPAQLEMGREGGIARGYGYERGPDGVTGRDESQQ